jgi:hypothetical protein
VHSRSLLSTIVAATIVGGMTLSAEPAHAGPRAFIGGLVGGAVTGALIGSALATPRYYYGGPAYVVPPPPPVYPVPAPYYPPYYPPQFCPRGLYCR